MYDYTDYKTFLKMRLERGTQRLLAEHIGCQSAFLSQVLRGKPHLSLEQGILASEYFHMNSSEQEYFILALQHGRAGSTKLGDYFAAKMAALREVQQRVDSQLGAFDELGGLSKATYYSSWKFAVVLILLTLPTTNQNQLLKTRTGLSDREIEKIIEFLKNSGLAEKRSGRWQPTKMRIHLRPDDMLIGTHHKNFRNLCLNRLEDLKPDSLHYSSIMALSKTDAAKVKSLLLATLAKAEGILKPSPEETARIFCIDYFEP